jgi:hypothetical protein
MGIIYVKNHQVLDLPFFFMFHLPLRLLYGLATFEENAVGDYLGDCSRPDMGNL